MCQEEKGYNYFMVTVILPGYDAHNKEWLEETAEKINLECEIMPIYWEHWIDTGKRFNPEEKARLIGGVIGMQIFDIIAKSIGTLAAAYLIQRGPEKVNKVILNGICLNDLNENDKEIIKAALKLIPAEKIICYQNEEDPHGNFDQAKNFLSGINSEIVIILKPGDNHEYPYFEEFHNFLLK